MSGDICPLKELTTLKEKFDFLLVVDEAHSFGLYGDRGKGLCQQEGVLDKVDFLTSTFSKATASIGGFVATKSKYVSYLQWSSNAFAFQACFPPADAATILAAMDIMENNPSIIDRLHENNQYMRQQLMAAGFDLGNSQSPVIPVYIPDTKKLLRVCFELYKGGVFSVPISYPAVREDEGRIRFIVNTNHTKEQIDPTQNNTQMVLVYGPTAWWDDFKQNLEDNFMAIFRFCAPEIAKLVENAQRTEKFKACGTMPAFQRETYGNGWALVGDAGSFKDQVTAMGITHSFRDAELITSFLHPALLGEISMAETLAEYQQIRASDYQDYFNMVCHVAEMNSYSQAELKYFYSIKDNKELVNQLISQFGDTLPINAGIEAQLLPEVEYPEFIQEFDSNSYSNSFPIRQSNSLIQKELIGA